MRQSVRKEKKMPDREKVIFGLKCLTNEDPYMSRISCHKKKCPYAETETDNCAPVIWRDALELLKAQEPRVLTLYEIQTLPNGDETNAPVVTEQRVPIGTWDGGSICQWRGAAFVQETAEDHAYYNWDTYGQNWRCWTALPTKKQRTEAKWDADP